MSDAERRFRRSGCGRVVKSAEPCKQAGPLIENARKRRVFTLAILGTLLVSAAIAVGCGSAESTESITASVKFDRSTTTAPPAIREGYAEAGAALIEAVVARGGSLRLGVFRGASVEVATLEGDPAVSSARRERDLEEEGALATMASTLEGVLGLTRPTPELATQLNMLPPGSAVAAALRLAVEDVRAGPGEPIAVVVSDGRDNKLPDGVRDDDASAGPPALAEILSKELGGLDASGVTVILAGIGQGLPAAPAARLIEAWRIACKATGAARCLVDADPGAVAEVIE